MAGQVASRTRMLPAAHRRREARREARLAEARGAGLHLRDAAGADQDVGGEAGDRHAQQPQARARPRRISALASATEGSELSGGMRDEAPSGTAAAIASRLIGSSGVLLRANLGCPGAGAKGGASVWNCRFSQPVPLSAGPVIGRDRGFAALGQNPLHRAPGREGSARRARPAAPGASPGRGRPAPGSAGSATGRGRILPLSDKSPCALRRGLGGRRGPASGAPPRCGACRANARLRRHRMRAALCCVRTKSLPRAVRWDRRLRGARKTSRNISSYSAQCPGASAGG